MQPDEETVQSVKNRLEILEKALVSELNSVEYYRTLIENTPEDSEGNIGARRIYADLREEEKKHVQIIRDFIQKWEEKLAELKN